jgi:3-methyl-2-oxobutanoate hydroxymethyltransferase
MPTRGQSERIASVTFKTDPGTHAALRGEKMEPVNALYGGAIHRRITTLDIVKSKGQGKWAMLTSYEQLTAEIFEQAGIPVLLVGDSAGNNFLGAENTISVTVDEMISLARAVVSATRRALVVADLPFGSFEHSPEQALQTSIRFFKEAGVQAVKIEGGAKVTPQIKALIKAGIPVMGHLGLTPQSIHTLGGYRVQGRGENGAAIIADALALQEAGVFSLVLELVPAELAAEITAALEIPTIGIGAGKDCDAQVLVWSDLMGLTAKPPKLAKAYRNLREEMSNAVKEWSADVASGAFPNEGQTFH